MLGKVKFKHGYYYYIPLLFQSHIVHIQKYQLDYGISTMVGQNCLFYVWLKSQITTGNQRKCLAKTVLCSIY